VNLHNALSKSKSAVILLLHQLFTLLSASTKNWLVEIFEGRSSELRSIGGGPASKNKSIQHDQIVRLKRSTNSGVAAAMSGFADSSG
jgi:hypothetical protein